MRTTRNGLCVTIAGSDSSCAAGAQTDLLSFFCVSQILASPAKPVSARACAITATTAQSAQSGVRSLAALPANQVRAQLEAIAEDGALAAVKIGMLGTAEIIAAVADFLRQLPAKQRPIVICDPLLNASSGESLLAADALPKLIELLLPLVDVLTPNLLELGRLRGRPAPMSLEETADCAMRLLEDSGARSALVKGGHRIENNEQDKTNNGAAPRGARAYDFWSDGRNVLWLMNKAVPQGASRGSGCALSAAIAQACACGLTFEDALIVARAYIQRGIRKARPQRSEDGPRFFAHDSTALELQDLPMAAGSIDEFAADAAFLPCGARAGEKPIGLYPVVPSADWVQRLLTLGVDCIQLRVKDRPKAEAREEIRRAAEHARNASARLFVNDYWREAIEFKAYGVHLGQEDLAAADLEQIRLAGLRLGLSTHSWLEIAKAHAAQPSYIAIGPIYETKSKPMAFAPQGLEQLRQWAALLSPRYPVVAIGGIDAANIAQVSATGVEGVAMIRAVTEPENLLNTIDALRRLLKL